MPTEARRRRPVLRGVAAVVVLAGFAEYSEIFTSERFFSASTSSGAATVNEKPTSGEGRDGLGRSAAGNYSRTDATTSSSSASAVHGILRAASDALQSAGETLQRKAEAALGGTESETESPDAQLPPIKNIRDVVRGNFSGYLIAEPDKWKYMIFTKNEFCPHAAELIANSTSDAASGRGDGRVLINLTLGCLATFKDRGLGTGNWLTSLYSNRMDAFASDGVDLLAWCPDAEEEKRKLILPWVMGYWKSRSGSKSSRRRNETRAPGYPWPLPQAPKEPVKLSDRCGAAELAHMAPHIMYDLRRMAVAIAGIPSPDHPSAEWAERHLWSSDAPARVGPDVTQIPSPERGDVPLFSGLTLDDAALHFRCGDLMSSNHPGFGFMKYSAYGDRISPAARSVGIVTSPYGPAGQNRHGAENNTRAKEACRRATEGLRDYLRERFPSAIVSVRNGEDETIATSYARLVMANETVVGMGSFGVFPAIAAFGRGYIRRPDFAKADNRWVEPLPDMYEHIELFDAPQRLMAETASKLQRNQRWEDMLRWFRNDTITCRDVCVRQPCKWPRHFSAECP